MGIDTSALSSMFLPGCYIENVDATGDNEFRLIMKYAAETPAVCEHCGGRLYKHDNRTVVLTDTTVWGKPAKLVVTYPRKRCKDCRKLWVPVIEGVDENHMMTTRAFEQIADEALRHSFEDISLTYGISANTAKNVFVDYVDDSASLLRFKTPAFLGIDEIKIKKIGEVTVVTDLEHRTLYDMMEGRNQPSLTKYFSQMPDAEKVFWVCTDMYRPFEKSINTALPNARWVVDHFHIVAYANRAMDAVRVAVQKELTKRERIATKKGLAYTLRTRAKRLSAEEAAKIKMCRTTEKLKPLATAFDLKEDFFDIYDSNPASKDDAMQAFADWETSIPEDDIYESFRDLAKTVHNFYEQIFNYWDCPIRITNGFTECTNRIIRENNVKGRGNSFKILRARTLYRKTNIQRAESSGLLLGPMIPQKGPVFHFEETKGIDDSGIEDPSKYFNSFDYDPLIGLIPGEEFDPETGEIYDDVFEEEPEE